MAEHTPEPWRWVVNPKSREIRIDGPGLVVMDFARWGMNGATPRFRRGMVMVPAAELSVPIPGSEHHAEWDRLLDHPDARLVIAAPELLTACRALLRTGLNGGNNIRLVAVGVSGKPCDVEWLKRADDSDAAVELAMAAIAKAEGRR